MNLPTQPTRHLTHEQLANLLLADRPSDAGTFDSEEIERSEEHLRGCALCVGELDSLRQSLALFRSTADAWAQHAWESTAERRGIDISRLVIQTGAAESRSRGIRFSAGNAGLAGFFARPAVWGAAAAIALFGAALPIALHRFDGPQPAQQTTNRPAALAHANETTQSDEALLLEINQTLSSSVPAPMQPLADPTAGNNSNTAAPRKN
jgi:hypothetical protein